MKQFFLFSSLLFACFPDTACHDKALDSANEDFSIIQHLFALDLLEKRERTVSEECILAIPVQKELNRISQPRWLRTMHKNCSISWFVANFLSLLFGSV